MLSRLNDPAYALLRAVSGLMFAFHGAQKLFGLYGARTPPLGSQLWFGGIIELVSGLLIAAGLFTPIAAFIASGTMAVAYLQFHWKGAGGSAFFPAINKGELALLYSVLFLYISTRGSGPWALSIRRR